MNLKTSSTSKTIKINKLPSFVNKNNIEMFVTDCIIQTYPELVDILGRDKILKQIQTRFKYDFESDYPSFRKYAIRTYYAMLKN
tara:strand:+ start:260 stop:511 length:252 start_codon:yes stop_codon:yes gene_type:complete